MQAMRTARGAGASFRRAHRAPRQRLTERRKVCQLCLTRFLRKRNLAGGDEDTGMFGLLCGGMRHHATICGCD